MPDVQFQAGQNPYEGIAEPTSSDELEESDLVGNKSDNPLDWPDVEPHADGLLEPTQQERVEKAKSILDSLPLKAFAYANPTYWPFAATKPFTGVGPRDIVSAQAQSWLGAAGLAGRAVPFVSGDPAHHAADALEQASKEMFDDEGGVLPPSAQQAARGATRSLVTSLPLGILTKKPQAIAAYHGLEEASRAYTTGKDEGLEGAYLGGFVVAEGLIEAVPAMIFNRLDKSIPGLGGLETSVTESLKKAAKDGVSGALKKLGIALGAELPEELLTEFAHLANNAMWETGPEFTAEGVRDTFEQTAMQTLFSVGAVQGGKAGLAAQEGLARERKLAQARQFRDQRRTEARQMSSKRALDDPRGEAQKLFEAEPEAARAAAGWALNPKNADKEGPSRREWTQFGFSPKQRLSKKAKGLLAREIVGIVSEQVNDQYDPNVMIDLVSGKVPAQEEVALHEGEEDEQGDLAEELTEGVAFTVANEQYRQLEAEDRFDTESPPVTQRDFFARVAELFGIQPRISRPEETKANFAAWYDRLNRVIGMLRENITSIDILTHEVAHDIERTTAIEQVEGQPEEQYQAPRGQRYPGNLPRHSWIRRLARQDPEIARDLSIMDYYDLGQNGDHIGEGWAEFIRYWVTNPDGPLVGGRAQQKKSKAEALRGTQFGPDATIRDIAPNLTRAFEEGFKKDHPDIYQKLEQLREIAGDFNRQGALGRLRATVGANQPFMSERMSRHDRILTAIKDKAYVLLQMRRQVDHIAPYMYSKDNPDGIAPSASLFWSANKNYDLQASLAYSEGMFLNDPTGLIEKWNNAVGREIPQDVLSTPVHLQLSNVSLEFEDNVFSNEAHRQRAIAYVQARHMKFRIERAWRRRGRPGNIRDFAKGNVILYDGGKAHGFRAGANWDDLLHVLDSVPPDDRGIFDHYYDALARVNDDILRAMLWDGQITQDEYDNIMKEWKGNYIPQFQTPLYEQFSLVPGGILHTESFLKKRAETVSDTYKGSELPVIDPSLATQMRMRAFFRAHHQRNLLRTMLLETSREFYQLAREKGVKTPIPEAPEGLGQNIELVDRRYMQKHGVTLKKMLDWLVNHDLMEDNVRKLIRRKDLWKTKYKGDAANMPTRTFNGTAAMLGIDLQEVSKEDAIRQINEAFGSDDIHDADIIFEHYSTIYPAIQNERIAPVTLFGEKKYVRLSPEIWNLMHSPPRKASIPVISTAMTIAKWGYVGYNAAFGLPNIAADVVTAAYQGKQEMGNDPRGVVKYIAKHPLRSLYWFFRYASFKTSESFHRRFPNVARVRPIKDDLFSLFDRFSNNIHTRTGWLHHDDPWVKKQWRKLERKLDNVPGWSKVNGIVSIAGFIPDVAGTWIAGTDAGPRIAQFIDTIEQAGYRFVPVKDPHLVKRFFGIRNTKIGMQPTEWMLVDTRTGQRAQLPDSIGIQAFDDAAKVTTPFQMHGASPAVQYLDALLFFVNASIQSTGEMLGNYRKALGLVKSTPYERRVAKQRVVASMITQASVTLALMLMFGDDDWYKEQPSFMWTRYHMIPLGGEKYIRIKKPYEYQHFPNVIEGVFRSMTVEERNEFREALKAEIEAKDPTGFLSTGGVANVPVITPVMEAKVNYSGFRGRAIESEGEQRLPVWQRGRERASALAIGISDLGMHNFGWSPAKIDHVIEGLTGNVGKNIAEGDFINLVTGYRGVYPERMYTQSVQDFYKMKEERTIEYFGKRTNKGVEFTGLHGDVNIDKRYSELMSALRDERRLIENPTEKVQYDNMIVSLARDRLGRSTLPKYGDFWKRELPPPASRLRSDFRESMVRMKNRNAPKRGSEDYTYRQAVEVWRDDVRAAADWLRTH